MCQQARSSRQSGDGMNLSQFKSCLEFQGRQDCRQPLRQHCLARSGRTNQQNVVTAGGGDLQRSFSSLLAAHLAEVDPVAIVVNQNLCKVDTNRSGRISDRIAAMRSTAFLKSETG